MFDFNFCCPPQSKRNLDYINTWIDGANITLNALTAFMNSVKAEDLTPMVEEAVQNYDWSTVPEFAELQSQINTLSEHDLPSGGTASQYLAGDRTWKNFPTIPEYPITFDGTTFTIGWNNTIAFKTGLGNYDFYLKGVGGYDGIAPTQYTRALQTVIMSLVKKWGDVNDTIDIQKVGDVYPLSVSKQAVIKFIDPSEPYHLFDREGNGAFGARFTIIKNGKRYKTLGTIDVGASTTVSSVLTTKEIFVTIGNTILKALATIDSTDPDNLVYDLIGISDTASATMVAEYSYVGYDTYVYDSNPIFYLQNYDALLKNNLTSAFQNAQAGDKIKVTYCTAEDVPTGSSSTHTIVNASGTYNTLILDRPITVSSAPSGAHLKMELFPTTNNWVVESLI